MKTAVVCPVPYSFGNVHTGLLSNKSKNHKTYEKYALDIKYAFHTKFARKFSHFHKLLAIYTP